LNLRDGVNFVQFQLETETSIRYIVNGIHTNFKREQGLRLADFLN